MAAYFVLEHIQGQFSSQVCSPPPLVFGGSIDAPTFFSPVPQLGVPHILLVHPQGAAHPPGVFLYSVST